MTMDDIATSADGHDDDIMNDDSHHSSSSMDYDDSMILFTAEEDEEEEETNGTVTDHRMSITASERDRALRIKRAIEACPDVANIPDYECVKLAIVCPCQTESEIKKILEVTYKLQCFREQYKLDETPQDAVATLRQFFHHQPGLLLDVTYLPTSQSYTSAADMAKMNYDNLQTDEQWRAWQGGCYYWIRSMESDFASIRNGVCVVSECEGMSLVQNFEAQIRSCTELWAYYPARHKELVWLNTPTAANLFYSVLKRIVNTELLQSWKLGGGLEGYDGRLDELFAVPTLEIAQEALLQRMENYLCQRYHNIQSFSLDDDNNSNNEAAS